MPIDLETIPPALKEAARCGNLVPFVGAGVSRHAKLPRPPVSGRNTFPTWTELLAELENMAVVQHCITLEQKDEIDDIIKQGKYLMAAEILKTVTIRDQVDTLLHTIFAPEGAEPGRIHDLLFALQPALILTTNYDELLELAYSRLHRRPPNVKTFKDASEVVKFLKAHERWVHHPLIFKIHGSVTTPSEAVFAESDYRNLRYREHGYHAVLSAIFVTRVVLMLGFSFSDPEISILTESLRESLGKRSSPDYIVLPKGQKKQLEKKRLEEDFGLQVIEYEPEPNSNHPELLQLVERLVECLPSHVRTTAASA